MADTAEYNVYCHIRHLATVFNTPSSTLSSAVVCKPRTLSKFQGRGGNSPTPAKTRAKPLPNADGDLVVFASSKMLGSNGKFIALLLVVTTLVAIFFDRQPANPSEGFGSKQAVILCFGDSLTAGYVVDEATGSLSFFPYSAALSASLGPHSRAIPLGFPGWRSMDLLEASDQELSKLRSGVEVSKPGLSVALKQYKPVLAIMLVGTNDLLKAISPGDLNGTAIAARVWNLHEIAHRAQVRTLALGIPEWDPELRSLPHAVSNAMRDAARKSVNNGLSRMAAASGGNSKYLEFPLPFRKKSPDWSWDGVHFSPEGYSTLGRALSKTVKEVFPDVALAAV